MKLALLLLLFFTSIPSFIYPETYYKTRNEIDIPLLLGSALTAGSSFYLLSNIQPLSLNQIDSLDPSMVNRFDRMACKFWSPEIADYSDYLLMASLLSPVSLISFHAIRQDAASVGLMYFESILISGGVTQLIKAVVKRTRPFAYNNTVPKAVKLNNRDMRESFHSGHTALAFTALVFTATVYEHYHSDSEYMPYIWSGAIGTASTIGLFRILAGKHFPTDVITGALIGSAVGYLIPKIHEKEIHSGKSKPHIYKVSVSIPI